MKKDKGSRVIEQKPIDPYVKNPGSTINVVGFANTKKVGKAINTGPIAPEPGSTVQKGVMI